MLRAEGGELAWKRGWRLQGEGGIGEEMEKMKEDSIPFILLSIFFYFNCFTFNLIYDLHHSDIYIFGSLLKYIRMDIVL